jgi:hypothetical protein
MRSFLVTDTAIHPIPKQRKFRRALAGVGAWIEAHDYTGCAYALDRTASLEREAALSKEELRHGPRAMAQAKAARSAGLLRLCTAELPRST